MIASIHDNIKVNLLSMINYIRIIENYVSLLICLYLDFDTLISQNMTRFQILESAACVLFLY